MKSTKVLTTIALIAVLLTSMTLNEEVNEITSHPFENIDNYEKDGKWKARWKAFLEGFGEGIRDGLGYTPANEESTYNNYGLSSQDIKVIEKHAVENFKSNNSSEIVMGIHKLIMNDEDHVNSKDVKDILKCVYPPKNPFNDLLDKIFKRGKENKKSYLQKESHSKNNKRLISHNIVNIKIEKERPVKFWRTLGYICGRIVGAIIKEEANLP